MARAFLLHYRMYSRSRQSEYVGYFLFEHYNTEHYTTEHAEFPSPELYHAQ